MVDDPICPFCGRAVQPQENKATVQGAIYHSRCWERKARGQRRG